ACTTRRSTELDEDLEEGEVAGAELDGAIADVGAAGADVDGDVPGPQHCGPLRVGGAQSQTDAGEEFVEGEGLAHVVIGPAGQARDGVLDGLPGGEDDDWKLMAFAADHAQHAEPVESGQTEIEDDEVVAAGAHEVDRLVAVLDDVGG